jgi:hypothetical protein
MHDAKKPVPPRRALLQKGAALTLGAIGLSGGSAGLAAAAGTGGLRFYVRRRRTTRPPGRASETAMPAGGYGELLAELDGPALGTFHANGLGGMPTTGLAAAPQLELQTFTLEDGMLFGLGANGKESERTCAVLGGTGRFAGASGTYVEREVEDPRAGRGVVEFLFRIG